MASRAFHHLLLHCQDNLSRNGRGTFLAIVALLIFHLAVITPFADAGRRKAEASADRQRLAAVGPALDEAQQILEEANATALKPFQRALDDFTEGLALDLARLEASRWQWQQASQETTDDERAVATDETVDTGLQMETAPRGAVPLPIDESQREAFALAPNRYALLSLLEPFVDETLVAPRLQTLERSWQADTLPPLSSRLDAMGNEISKLRSQFPEAKTSWDALSAALTEFSREAQEWQPQAPNSPYWWASPESQPRLTLGLGNFEESLRRPKSLAQMAITQQQVLDRLATVQTAWERRRAEIPAADAELGGFLGLDLDGFTPLFPLALGLLLAAAIWRRSRLMTELARVTGQAISQGSPPELASWFGGQVSPGQLGEASSRQLAKGARRRVVVHLLLSWSWLAAAGYQLYGRPSRNAWHQWTPAWVGAVLVLLAVVHRVGLLRRAFALLSETVNADTEEAEQGREVPGTFPSEGTENPFVDVEDDDLVETTLRR